MSVSENSDGTFHATDSMGFDRGDHPSEYLANIQAHFGEAPVQYGPEPVSPTPMQYPALERPPSLDSLGPTTIAPLRPPRGSVFRWLPNGRLGFAEQSLFRTVLGVAVPPAAGIAGLVKFGGWAALLGAAGGALVISLVLAKRYLVFTALTAAVAVAGFRYGPKIIVRHGGAGAAAAATAQVAKHGAAKAAAGTSATSTTATYHPLGHWNGTLSDLLLWGLLVGVVYAFRAMRSGPVLASWLRRTILACGVPGLALAVYTAVVSHNPFLTVLALFAAWGVVAGAVLCVLFVVLGLIEFVADLRLPRV